MQEYKYTLQRIGEEEKIELTRENVAELYDKTSDMELKKKLDEYLKKYM